ncbi:MAG TPA: sodium-translocating pyrophosphatase [Dehalococcoidia bacterium]|jgi:K(+)-stimulated pyrophosphate-energized sodium pump|nr:sodium-translocating pyrophosphatase [Chloroflexota bacterium]MDP5876155.1 sodium-translocating pyrophosphatase [Dehalococcoidia bacterium]MDP6273203.1 sodium-translocating pyrophosphatase [Dehalococcoidia bacterium]MDP7161250.1 sodium-translocating pyrophosphatase [Dehalococcoidia bacterium]MDP7214051.1 sodium-translocating pyrophosphatase [Dehalococcoidia bacterium]|tara:strand:- start:517 stop:2610 length:2094 start_codon:yes stop_codon:yes gene_type:complete
MKDAPELLWFAIAAGAIGLIAAAITAIGVLRKDQGSDEVREIGNLIKEGANAFLKREYLILSVFVVVVAVIIGVFVDYNILGNAKIDELNGIAREAGVDADGPWTAIAYLFGAIGSGLAGYVGMSIAVRANTRTATAAQDGLNSALRVAFGSGTVMGLTVTGIGLLGIVILWTIFRDPNIVAGFGFGASSIALFARVGGGIYTKAADVGADLVGKVEAGIPEDDPRNPATIADNVGDNVGDVAGMGADLFESYVGAMIASLALAAIGAGFFSLEAGGFDSALLVLPMAIAGIGIIASIIGTFLVRTGPNASMGRLLWSLRTGIFGAGILALAATALVINGLDLPFELFWVVVTGLVVGQVIGTATEYFTSYENKPTQWIAKQSETGAGSVVIAGIAMGLLSTVIPAFAIVAGILIADELAGLYGVAVAAVGMLSTLGITLATDAYGPVADNAGGIAEQGHLDPEVRERTDALDALGNTTAATGKGFAIGSAVLTALALMVAYVTVTDIDPKDLSIIEPQVLVGMIIGGMLPFLFAALTMQAVGTAANAMIVEVRRQFREIPGLREGKEGVKPDAARAVDISTQGALKAMFLPGLIAVVSPVLVGALVSAEALGGLLIGSIVSGFLLAIFMANAGGAWDNAKKYVELGHHGGKGSDEHAAAVVGDTVGDPFKDTSGPAINILLKLMAVVSVIFGPLFI